MRRVRLLPLLLAATPLHAATDGQAWVEMAPDGGSLVRVVTTAGACPVVQVDGRATPMVQRAAPADLAVRTNKAQVTTPASFPGRVCELPLPRHTGHASLGGQALALPRAQINRIVLIGDTGCRLKGGEKAWQGCNDPAQWPFAAIATRAATLHPDLVLHVGDYLYRENPCPSDQQSCAGATWGYGEQGWRADFLTPAAPLLAAAPWVMVRGNHEECDRAGQGWWRLLDPHRLGTGADCLDPANDATGNHTDPYAVDLGGGAQLVVADLMQLASGKPKDTAVAATFAADMAQIDRLSHGAKDTFVTAHFPLNAVLWNAKATDAVTIGSKPISAFAPPPLPHVRAMLAGHIHLFQVAHFTDRPSQVITGFSGTAEDVPHAPTTLSEAAGKPGAATLDALTTIGGRFGYALLERDAHGWNLTAFAADGTTMGQFSL
jgi:hypothetical protein